MTYVAKAAPDGYTVLIAITQIIQAPNLGAKLPYDVFKDLAPVTQVGDLDDRVHGARSAAGKVIQGIRHGGEGAIPASSPMARSATPPRRISTASS